MVFHLILLAGKATRSGEGTLPLHLNRAFSFTLTMRTKADHPRLIHWIV